MDATTTNIIIGAASAAGGALLPVLKRWVASNTSLGRERIKVGQERDRERARAEQGEINWLRTHVADLGHKMGELEGRVHSLESERISLLEKLAQANLVIAKRDAELARKQEHIDTFEEENRALEAEITRLKSERNCATCPERAKAATV
jgi:chromosome segregation ATPase